MNTPVSSVPSFSLQPATWFCTTAALVGALLVLEQSIYRYKKRHLPGAKWTIPIIGKFADSLKPTMEGYMAQWNSGALSAVSVFNMSVLRGTFIFDFNVRFTVSSLWHPPTSIRVRSSTLQSMPSRASSTLQSRSSCQIIGLPVLPLHSCFPAYLPPTRVFLNGKAHVEYRKILNTLFTPKALRCVC